MFEDTPSLRATIEEIKSHAWMNMEVPTEDQILEEFNRRKQQINDEKKKEI